MHLNCEGVDQNGIHIPHYFGDSYDDCSPESGIPELFFASGHHQNWDVGSVYLAVIT